MHGNQGLCGLNFPPEPKEGAFRLFTSACPDVEQRERKNGGAWNLLVDKHVKQSTFYYIIYNRYISLGFKNLQAIKARILLLVNK